MSQDLRLKLSERAEKEWVEIHQGTKISNSITYKIHLEDHTIGDLLRIFLLKDDEVKFAGYKVPHPLENILELKVQTNGKHPRQVMISTLEGLQKDLFELEGDFDEAIKIKSTQYH